LLEISGSLSNIISDSYVFHDGSELVSRTGNKEIRHSVTTNYDQKYPFAHSARNQCFTSSRSLWYDVAIPSPAVCFIRCILPDSTLYNDSRRHPAFWKSRNGVRQHSKR